jgi:hypothetical protein
VGQYLLSVSSGQPGWLQGFFGFFGIMLHLFNAKGERAIHLVRCIPRSPDTFFFTFIHFGLAPINGHQKKALRASAPELIIYIKSPTLVRIVKRRGELC